MINVVVGIAFSSELRLVGFLHIVAVTLFLTEMNGVLLRVELHVSSLHVIRRTGPSHQRIFPSTSTLQNIPIYSPVMRCCLCALSRGRGRSVDSHRSAMDFIRSSTDYTSLSNSAFWSFRDGSGIAGFGFDREGGERGGSSQSSAGHKRSAPQGTGQRHCQ